jgi:hypothetical protein
MTRVLVCGGRDYADKNRVWRVLFQIAPTLVIQGGARGADLLALDWAFRHRVPIETYRADWKRDGKAAGPIRNQRMIDEGKPDLVVAFPGERGTADMVRRARKAGIPVREITP